MVFCVQKAQDSPLSLQAVNTSVLSYTPKISDHNKVLLCRVENPDLSNSAIQDSLELQVHCKYRRFFITLLFPLLLVTRSSLANPIQNT